MGSGNLVKLVRQAGGGNLDAARVASRTAGVAANREEENRNDLLHDGDPFSPCGQRAS